MAFDFGEQPIVHHLLDRQDSVFETFQFIIGYCHNCSFLQMLNYPNPEILYENYITLSSWKPQPHAKYFLENIARLFGLRQESKILEIGCNDGGFLELIRSVGFLNVLGIEPTQDASRSAVEKGLPVIRTFYGLETIDDLVALFPTPDLIVSRQVIEHIPDLNGFLSAARIHLAPGGGLALEFPDHSMNFEQLDYSFWEEHVNYFTIHTIRQLLARHGFEIFHHESTLFSGKCLFVFARRVDAASVSTYFPHDERSANRYIRAFPSFVTHLHLFLDEQTRNGPIVMYGCGSRSSNFINLTRSSRFFNRFVDDQTEKQGKFAPGSFLKVTDSQHLDPTSPVALGVNSENEFKVIKTKNLTRGFSVLPPSGLLPDFWKALSRV